ncbi:MAG: ABC transporter substrate-binding protein, partial [Actinomycetota bacterium]
MRRTMARRGPNLLVGIFLVLTACAGGSENQIAEETLTPVRGGTVVFASSTGEPAVMNPLTIDGNTVATALVAQTLLEGAYETLPDFTYRPELLAGEAEVTHGPFTITYTIREDATWSDGEPVGAADFEFTWKTIVDPKFKAAVRDGYDKITDSEIIDPKTIRFTFDEPFVPYRELFNFVLPAHALEDGDLNQVWDDEITVSSGPFEFEQWKRGQFATVVRNDAYRGEGPYLDEIVFRFVTDPGSQIQLFRSREADVLYPQPQVDLVEQLTSFGGASLEASAGAVWEHIDFNLDTPLLQEPFVRQAIAHGIDRRAIVD